MAPREIALAFGVPALLLGLPGDNTYANYAEANRAFWQQSVLPLVDRTLGSVAHRHSLSLSWTGGSSWMRCSCLCSPKSTCNIWCL